jgi:hypothetical protein
VNSLFSLRSIRTSTNTKETLQKSGENKVDFFDPKQEDSLRLSPFSCSGTTGKILLLQFFLNLSKIESPLKRMLPYGGLDGAKYTKNSRDFFTFFPPDSGNY